MRNAELRGKKTGRRRSEEMFLRGERRGTAITSRGRGRLIRTTKSQLTGRIRKESIILGRRGAVEERGRNA